MAPARRAARSADDLVDGDAVEERERVAGGGNAAAGKGVVLEVVEGYEAGGLGRGGEVVEDVLEEDLVAGEHGDRHDGGWLSGGREMRRQRSGWERDLEAS